MSVPSTRSRWSVAAFFERFIYSGRWLLSPMYVGLLVVLGLYVWHYITDLIDLCRHFGAASETTLMLAALATVDTVMVANLLAFIMIGSYTIFVRQLKLTDDAPQWLRTITSGTLKTKMGTSLVGISSIRLLRDFIGDETLSHETLYKHVGLHLVFLVSAFVLANIDRLSHPAAPDAAKPAHP